MRRGGGHMPAAAPPFCFAYHRAGVFAFSDKQRRKFRPFPPTAHL